MTDSTIKATEENIHPTEQRPSTPDKSIQNMSSSKSNDDIRIKYSEQRSSLQEVESKDVGDPLLQPLSPQEGFISKEERPPENDNNKGNIISSVKEDEFQNLDVRQDFQDAQPTTDKHETYMNEKDVEHPEYRLVDNSSQVSSIKEFDEENVENNHDDTPHVEKDLVEDGMQAFFLLYTDYPMKLVLIIVYV